jgi:hypothetical protein
VHARSCHRQCTDATSIVKLTERYHQHINALIRTIIDKRLLVDVVGTLRPWVAHAATSRKV